MRFCSRSFRALLRRNLIYRKRKPVSSLLELLLPIGFICILVAIKLAVKNTDGFFPETVEPSFPSNKESAIPFSFTDYVTAIQAERKCISNGRGFSITGMTSVNWQVPFVKCDSRRCERDGQDARDELCEFSILAVAPEMENDELSTERVKRFMDYVFTRYPQLNTVNENDEPNVVPGKFAMVQAFSSDAEMSKYIQESDYGKAGSPKISLGVVFSSKDQKGNDYDYTIRLNSTNVNNPEEAARLALTTPSTGKLFESFQKTDYNSCEGIDGTPYLGILGSSCTGQYIYNGAITIQRLVGDWILDDSGAKGAGYAVSDGGVQFVSFPTREYEEDGFYAAIETVAPLLVILGLLYPFAAIVRAITMEKETRQKELMKMMSVSEADINWSWFTSYMVFHLITTIGATIATSVLYSNSSALLLFVFWLITILSAVIVFPMFIASFNKKATRGTLIGVLIFFVGFVLAQIFDYKTRPGSILRSVSLHPVAALSYGLQEIGRLEDLGVGVTEDSFSSTDSPSGYSFNTILNSLLFDAILYGILAWYLNRVVPSDFGQTLPWNYPFTKVYWCPGSVTVPLEGKGDALMGLTEEEASSQIPNEPVSDALKEQENEGRCIQIHGLRKEYGKKTAVDGLRLNMYSGQVTALLGHNGAGKTTTINMLTGMVAPTEGHAIVAGKDIRTQVPEIRQDLGICLQHDCLFPVLTVKEHIQFFARIKGLYAEKSEEEAEASIKTSIEDVALSEKSNTLSDQLSGGMKRKLSVAIAFCGGSKTVLLDEPTSGMDPFSRRFTWNVIKQYRANRTIILTTHFMDEADILGDRIAIMAEGQLRCAGSSMFLKRSYGVGYQLTIEKKSKQSSQTDTKSLQGGERVLIVNGSSSNIDAKLQNIVTGTVSDAKLLSNVGTELSFQLPLGASSSFGTMFDKLDSEVDNDEIVTYGVGITTLDEVFLMVARGESGDSHHLASSTLDLSGTASQPENSNKSYRSTMDMDTTGLFYRHCRALFQKRAMNFKRDKKAWCSSTILPSLFVFLGLLTFKFASPSRELGALTLTLKDYNPEVNKSPRNPIPFNNKTYMCQPGECLFGLTEIQESDDQVYSYCGRSAWIANKSDETCTITQSIGIMAQITEDGAEGTPENVSTITTSANALFNSSLEFIGTQYGALYFTHDSSSQTSSLESYGNATVAACEAYYTQNSVANYTDISQCEYYRGIAYVVSYNFTALHSSLLYQAVADEAIMNEAMGGNDKYSITATVHPLPFTALEKNFNAAEDSFTTWFLIVLSFPFIAGSFGSFVVAERLSKAKHLQTVAGVKPSAYWLSTYAWDVLNYQLPMWITVILIFSFSLTTFTTTKGDVRSGVITTMFLFGPAGAGFTYCISFLFKSPSMCNLFIIIFNFMIGFAGPLVTFVLELIGKGDPGNRNEKLLTVSTIIKWVLRPVPSFCLGDALFRTINLEEYRILEGDPKLTVWDPPMLLWDVIFLILESILYLLLAILIDKWSTNPRIITMFKNICTCKCLFGTKPVNEGITAALPDDDDVVAEAERVSSGDAIDDMIVVKNLTKQYPNGKLAVNNVSYGIPRGECFGLLGINGAGKTSTMAMLTAEFPPTTGDATLSSFSVTNEPEKTRQRIGYCPQFDAHFMNMTGREHVEMYASIKGIALDVVKEAAKSKLAEVGLSELDSDRLSMGYSGGMKRKLSVACATIGQPQIVFLDEPSTGMDPVARRDMWEVISSMVIGEGLADEEKTSVILTTHSMEEAEALCPRIAIMANGKLRCVGSAQHLKTRFGQGYQVELKVNDVKDSDEDFKLIVAKLLDSRGSSSSQELVATAGVEEGATKFEDIFLNLYQARHALGVLTGDDYLSSMLTATDPTGYVAWKSASTTVGIPLDELTDFAAEELRMKSLKEFIETTYANTTLRERQDNKVRYEVGSKDLRISSLFATIEENKEKLLLSDYGISQTSLEQVFNMHAAEAEKLKQGTNDA